MSVDSSSEIVRSAISHIRKMVAIANDPPVVPFEGAAEAWIAFENLFDLIWDTDRPDQLLSGADMVYFQNASRAAGILPSQIASLFGFVVSSAHEAGLILAHNVLKKCWGNNSVAPSTYSDVRAVEAQWRNKVQPGLEDFLQLDFDRLEQTLTIERRRIAAEAPTSTKRPTAVEVCTEARYQFDEFAWANGPFEKTEAYHRLQESLVQLVRLASSWGLDSDDISGIIAFRDSQEPEFLNDAKHNCPNQIDKLRAIAISQQSAIEESDSSIDQAIYEQSKLAILLAGESGADDSPLGRLYEAKHYLGCAFRLSEVIERMGEPPSDDLDSLVASLARSRQIAVERARQICADQVRRNEPSTQLPIAKDMVDFVNAAEDDPINANGKVSFYFSRCFLSVSKVYDDLWNEQRKKALIRVPSEENADKNSDNLTPEHVAAIEKIVDQIVSGGTPDRQADSTNGTPAEMQGILIGPSADDPVYVGDQRALECLGQAEHQMLAALFDAPRTGPELEKILQIKEISTVFSRLRDKSPLLEPHMSPAGKRGKKYKANGRVSEIVDNRRQ